MYALSCKLLIKGLLLEYFATLLQCTTPDENSQKMFHISSCIVLFLKGWSRTLFGDKDQISYGRATGRGKSVVGGEAQNEGYFCKIPIIKQDTNFISQIVGETNF